MTHRPLRLLFCATEYDYGEPSRGLSYEYAHFVPTLRSMPLELRTFDFVAEIAALGFYGAMDALHDVVIQWQPDVLLCFMFEEQLSRDLISWISRETPTTTAAWFADDHWRFENYSYYWAKAFNWVLTTDATAVDKYHAGGQPNVVLTQWACNDIDFHPTGTGLRYDVTFVGQPYGARVSNVEYLRRHGVNVEAWGHGWPNAPLSFEDMVRVFGESRINLNFSAGSKRGLMGLGPPTSAQIKGRVFEVPGCGGLLLTDRAEHLEDYYEPDREIVIFDGRRDLLSKIRHLLENESERAAIAKAGYQRTVRDHTYRKRLELILSTMGYIVTEPVT